MRSILSLGTPRGLTDVRSAIWPVLFACLWVLLASAGAQTLPAPDTAQPTPASAVSAASATGEKHDTPANPEHAAGPAAQAGATKPAAGTPPVPPSIAPALPPAKPTGRPAIGLALGGGGAPAMSEIGVLQWFEEHHIPVDMIAGTSMGCMVSALYSSGKTVDELKRVMDDSVFNSVFRFQSSYQSRSFRRREDSRDLPNALTIGLRHGVSFRNSLLTDQGLNAFLDREFLRYSDQTDFNAMPIPLRCLATDLNDAKTVTFARGSLPDAVRASVSLPGIYRPFAMDGHEYVDGGVLENLPTQTIHAMKADVVLAVSLPLPPVGKGELDSIVGVLQRSFSVAIEDSEERSRKLADVVMMPDVSGFSAADYLKTIDLAKRGYAAAEAQKAALLKYSLPDDQWADYLAERQARRRGPAGTVLRVRVQAPNKDLTHAVERSFQPLIGQPVNTTKIDGLLDEVRGDGRYDADYSVSYDPASATQPSILVTVADKKIGPPFLLVGANVEAQTGGVTRATLEGILLDQDLGGYGSELRTHIKAGFLTELSSEYYRALPDFLARGNGRLFAAPRIDLLREPFYIYQNQRRIAERQLENGGGGLDLGWSNKSSKELRLGWEMAGIRWESVVGTDGQPDISGSMQRVRAQYIYDNEDRALVPQFGLHSVTRVGYLYNATESENAPEITTNNTYAHQIGNNLFVMGGQAGTLFNRNVAEPFRFTLGGPLKLSASAIDEYRGTDYYLLQPSFLRRIATLPAPLGQSIYLGFSYEAGQMYAPHTPTITRQNILFGVVAETPLGIVTLAPAIGDSGHRKLVFTLGKFF
ncbi:patatin-like phospholipase family protein [Granulicella aggregans]|uniref:patatin-like phospholipase family protein n=1 Tax=Granulicella aggregans TaxID=474949 RepID=UPI0021E0CABF|nr:patatin-like phospholipase family protein [Granulicella aggregans]